MTNDSYTPTTQSAPVAQQVQKRGPAMMGQGAALLFIGIVLSIVFASLGFAVLFKGAILVGIILLIVGFVRWLIGK